MQDNGRRQGIPCVISKDDVDGKALVEGLVLKIANGGVPDYAKNWKILKLHISDFIEDRYETGEETRETIYLKAVFDYAEKHSDTVIIIEDFCFSLRR